MSFQSVLVVEDDPLIRLNIVEHLEEHGMTVFEAEDAEEAIGILEAREDIRLVFTDVQMPGTMDGLQLAHFVRKRWPPTIVVICSSVIQPEEDRLPTKTYWLSKPFDVESVSKAVSTARQWIGI